MIQSRMRGLPPELCPTPREFATSTLLPNGQVVIVGGDSGPTNPSPLESPVGDQ